MFYRRLKGQSTLEYVMMIGFIVAALIYLGTYVNRAVQGKMRDSTDQIGEQYDIRTTSSNYTTVSNLHQIETTTKKGGSTVTIDLGSETKTAGGGESVGAWTDKDWDGNTWKGK